MLRMFSDLQPFRRDPLGFLLGKAARCDDPLVPLYLGPTPAYLVADADLVKPILKAPESEINKGVHVSRMKPVIGENSLTMRSGPEHQRRRDALHGILAKGTVERLVPELTGEITRIVATVAERSTFDAHEIGAGLALRLVSVAVFGRNALSPADEQALIAVVEELEQDVADEMFRMLPLWPWESLRRKKARAAGREVLLGIVSRLRRRAAATSAMRALDEIGLTDAELADEVLTLLLAGHHTTGSNFSWILHRLAHDPDLTAAIRHEAGAVANEVGDLTAESLKHAPLSLAFCKEVLRLYPSSWWFARETQVDLTIGGRDLPKGAWLIVCPWQLHRDDRYWVEPDVLRLDRPFTSKAWIPFGVGSRACIGMGLAMIELQLMTLIFAQTFDLVSSAPLDVAPIAAVTLLPPKISITAEVAPAAVAH